MESGQTNFQSPAPVVAYGTFFERLIAKIVDGIIIGIAYSIVGYGVMAMVESTTGIYLGYLLGLIFQVVYNGYFLSSEKMATPGKQIFKLRVTDMNGGRITFGKAAGRTLCEIISGIILYIGYLMMLWDDKKQTLHDKIVGTLVVKAPTVENPQP